MEIATVGPWSALTDVREALAVAEAEATERPSLALAAIKHHLNRALAQCERAHAA